MLFVVFIYALTFEIFLIVCCWWTTVVHNN